MMPPLLPPGPVTVRVSGASSFSTTTICIVPVANVNPAMFSANSSGSGAAAGAAIYVKGEAQRRESLAVCSAQGCSPRELDLQAVDEVPLELYGTGIRNTNQSTTAKIGGAVAGITFVGAQPDFAGLDQVNLVIPKALAGRGEVDIVLTVDSKPSNPVRVKIK